MVVWMGLWIWENRRWERASIPDSIDHYDSHLVEYVRWWQLWIRSCQRLCGTPLESDVVLGFIGDTRLGSLGYCVNVERDLWRTVTVIYRGRPIVCYHWMPASAAGCQKKQQQLQKPASETRMGVIIDETQQTHMEILGWRKWNRMSPRKMIKVIKTMHDLAGVSRIELIRLAVECLKILMMINSFNLTVSEQLEQH